MIEVANFHRYVPHGREITKLQPRASSVEQPAEILSTQNKTEKSKSKDFWHLTKCESSDIEDEVYVCGCTAVWSRGSGNTKVLCKSFTVDCPIRNVLWCTFGKRERENPSKNNALKRSLCVVEEELIKAFSEDGNVEMNALPFKVANLLSIPGGLILERNVSQPETDQQKSKKVPTLFSLLSALDEPRPVVIRCRGKTSYMSESKLHIIFSSQNPPFVLTYDTLIGQHSIWIVREAKKEDYPEPTGSGDYLSSDSLPHPSPRYPTPILKSSAYSRLSITASPPSFLSQARTSSPSEKGPSRYPHSPYIPSPQVSRLHSARTLLQSPGPHSLVDSPSILQSPDIFRSPALVTNSFHEETFWHCIEPLEPEICLDHVWEETSTVRHGTKGRSNKAFITTDVCGVKYLCFLVPHISKLRLTKFSFGERPEQVIFGTTFDISAVDAVPIQDLNMILVLSPENNLTLYTGKFKGCEIKLIELEVILEKSMNSYANPEDSAMSISSEVMILSPVQGSRASQASSIPETSGSTVLDRTVREQKYCVIGLRETVGNAVLLQFNNNEMYRMTLPPLARDNTVFSCLAGLQQVLNNDVAAKLFLKYYQLTNGSSSCKYDPDEEWENFCETLWKLLGYRAPEESFSSVPAKKCKTNSDEGEEAWKFLLNGASGDLEFLKNAGFTVPSFIRDEAPETECAESASCWDSNAMLCQYFPSVVFVLHLVHENLKLSTLTWHGAEKLGKLLLSLTRTIGWDRYVDYYKKEYPHLHKEMGVPLKVEEQISKSQMFFPTFITQDLPNIYHWLMECLKGKQADSFPIIPNVCQQIYRVIMIYSLCIPREDGTYNENTDDLFNKNLFNLDFSRTALGRKTLFDINKEDYKRCRTPADRMVLFMAKTGFTKDDVEALPFGVSIPLREAIHQCRNNPSFHLPEESYTLIGREELAAQVRIHEEDFYNCGQPKAAADGEDVDDGMNFECKATKLRFSIDHRIREVRRLLQSARPVHVSLVQNPEVSDHDFVQEQEARLLLICKRTLSLSVGRGMFTLATSRPTLTELVPIPPLEITGRALPRNAVISLDHVDVPNDMLVWPAFHNGVAAGLKIVPGISQIDSTWIVYQRPKDNQFTNEHAGFLMALGLTGHLSNLAIMNVHNYLCKGHELTSVGLLIGLAATKRGTMDSSITKMLSIHIDALLPPTSAELDVPPSVMSAAVIGIGLVYQGTAHRLMTEVMLSEIGRPPGPEMENALNRECYSLSAGLALGLIMLEHGHGYVGVSDLNISDHLYHYMVGGHKKPQTGAQSEKFKSPSYLIKEGDNVDINVTAPGAILALGLIYLKSNNEIVASWLSAPETPVLAEFVRPDFLMLKLLSRGLIMWDHILPSIDWVESHIPKIFQDYAFKENSTDINDNIDIDFETISQTYVNIIAGCCLAMAMKFAGSCNQEAFNTLTHYTKYFKGLLETAKAEQCGRVILEQCLNTALLALSVVMAGSGNLDVLRIARGLHKRHSPEITYGNHMAVHMAIGFLFLGAGRSTLSTSGPAIAVLVCALFPQFPITSSDNRCHLQALRHLYVLAVEARLIIPRDVDTKEDCYVPVEITLKETPYYEQTVIKDVAPCMLPDFDLIKQVNICGQRYWPIALDGDTLSGDLRLIMSKGGTVFVKKRIDQLPYKQDPKGYRNLLARTFTEQAEKVDIIRSFSSDPELIQFTELFCQNTSSNEKEKRFVDFLSQVLLNCVSEETTSIIYTYFAMEKALQKVENNDDVRLLREILLVLTYYQRSFDRIKKNFDLKRSISLNYVTGVKTRLEAHFQKYVNKGVNELLQYIKSSGDFVSSELACYMTYHGIPGARELPLEFTQENVPLEVLIKKCKELQISLSSLLEIRSVLQR